MGGVGKWEGGGQTKFYPYKEGVVKKVLTRRKGGVKKVFELKYHV
jgi:hypothetical protein